MALMTKNKIKVLLALFVAGGVLHLLVDKDQSVYERLYRISAYLDSERLDSVSEATTDRPAHARGSYEPSTDRESDAYVLLNVNDTVDDDDWSNITYPFTRQDPTLKLCPLTPPNLVGPIRVWMNSPSMETLERLYHFVEPGGHGKPSDCKSRHKVAIVVPYRDREQHLRILLHNLHSFLTKQQLDYAIIVVEQVANQTFNRAKLMNVGFVEGMKLYPWECFIFHDVDLLPEDDRNFYSCPTIPRHMSVAVDKFSYKLPYATIFGGISAITVAQLRSINGFSNRYWGWGGEDDDLANRVALAGYKIARYPATIARYKMIKHVHESKSNPVNKCRYKLMAETKRVWKTDGLSSLKYNVLRHELLPLYTHIVVDLLEKTEKNMQKSQKC